MPCRQTSLHIENNATKIAIAFVDDERTSSSYPLQRIMLYYEELYGNGDQLTAKNSFTSEKQISNRDMADDTSKDMN
jgi:hypothetical protein